MWMKTETVGSPAIMTPALAIAITLALSGTLFFGVYPRALFDFADASARTLGTLVVTTALR
jgi:hypothetical protein